MRFGVLGPVRVQALGRDLAAGSGRERLILTVLLFNADRLISVDRLIDVLWDASPPPTARAQLHNMVSALRRRLRATPGGEVLRTRSVGYELSLGEHLLDLDEFRMRLERARSAAGRADHPRVVTLLTEALALWRGPTLADVAGQWAESTRQAVEDERLAAIELLLQSQLAMGGQEEVLAKLAPLAAEHPYQERLYEIRMLALVAAGRRVQALETYREVYNRFAADLGVQPGNALSSLHRRILTGEDPARSAPIRLVPRQLPPLPLELVGRHKLWAEVTATITPQGVSVPVGVLVGRGGIGKTSLAVSVAHELIRAYPDGQLYANLRGSTPTPADPFDVLAWWLRALGGSSEIPAQPDERASLFRSHLADRRILVLIDDAATEQQVRPLLPGSGSSAILVTSRSRLGGLLGVTRWTVPELLPADALALFTSVAGPARAYAEPEDATAIVAACGNMPLAVAISAARAAARPDLPLAEFRRRLSTARRQLDELAVGDLDVRATIALSYEALEPDAQAFFRRLGLLTATEYPAWVVDQLAGDRPGLVDRLVDVHLVERLGRDIVGQTRLRMHDLVADYARERAVAEETTHREIRGALVTSWLGLASRADRLIEHGNLAASGLAVPPAPDAGIAAVTASPQEWFDLERTNLVAAVNDAAELGLADLAGRLALRMSGYFGARGYEDRERILRAAVVSVREHGPDDLLGRLLTALIAAAAHHDRLGELSDLVREELAVAERTGDELLRVRALSQAGMVCRRLGNLLGALDWQHQAVSAASETVPLVVRTTALAGLAVVYSELGRPVKGLPYAREALTAERAKGNPRISALHGITLGILLTQAGRHADAEQELAGALQIAVAIKDELVVAFTNFRLAYVDLHLLRLQAAEAKLGRALEVFRAARDIGTTADIRRGFGDLAFLRGDLPAAKAHLQDALNGWKSTGARIELARTHARLEPVAERLGDTAAAQDHRRQWREILEDLDLDEGCLCLPVFLGTPKPRSVA